MRLGNSTSSLIWLTIWGAVLAVTLFAGCALRAVPVYRSGVPVPESRLPYVDRDQLLAELSLYQGTPYREGGNSLTGIDCSGLSRAIYSSLGVPLHRTALEQYGQGVPVRRESVTTGDLVFFGKGGRPSHVGIAVSKNQMMHSSSSRGVVLEEIDAFSGQVSLIGVRRVANLR